MSTTLNPADKNVKVLLTNSNLTCSVPDLTSGSVRSTTSKTAGKWHFELFWNYLPTNEENVGFGVANANQVLNNFIGDASKDSIGMYDDGLVFFNNASVLTTPPFPSQGNTSICEVDIGASRIWWASRPGAIWNNSATANPATGVGGIDYSLMSPLTPLFVMIDAGFNPIQTLNFGATPFAQTPSAGFSAWDTDPSNMPISISGTHLTPSPLVIGY